MSVSENQEALLAFIREQAQADSVTLLDLKQLSGGAIQENHGLRVRISGGPMSGERAFVVRSNAPASLSVSLSRAQEFAVLQCAHEVGVMAPRPYWLCTDPGVAGGEFYLMQWAAGSASPARLVKEDALTQEQRQKLTYNLGATIARLHQIQHSADTLPFLKQPSSTPAAQRIQEYRASLARLETAHPVIEAGLDYLEKMIPDGQRWVLSHCDFRTGNYMVQDGELTALLDWEFTAWSDPYEDLGWICARSWRFGANHREAGGVGDKADLFAGYESVAGHAVDPERVAYWELMASVRWAVIALEQSLRHLSGQQASLELALTGRMLPEIEQDLMVHLHKLVALKGTDDAAGSPAQETTSPAQHAPTAITDHDEFMEQPDGSGLLDIARSVLLNHVLPNAKKEESYNIRMIAKAMGIAMRELEQGVTNRALQAQTIQAFYAAIGRQPDVPSLQTLAQDIREKRFPDDCQPQLLAALDTLVAQRLALTNPRRLGDSAR